MGSRVGAGVVAGGAGVPAERIHLAKHLEIDREHERMGVELEMPRGGATQLFPTALFW